MQSTSRNVRLDSTQFKAWPQHAYLSYTTTMSMRRTSTSTLSTATRHEGNDHDLELIKADAQAWHSCSTANSCDATAASEFNACRLNFQSCPLRFKIEAMQKAKEKSLAIVKYRESDSNNLPRDFSQSLWDSYEIVAMSKRLEIALVFDGSYAGINELKHGVVERSRVVRKKRESTNSLRNLFNLMSSWRYNEPESSSPDGT